MDSASRRIIGWSMASRQDANLMCRALKAAIARRSYRTGTVIHHSDRGSQFTSKEFSELCQAHDVTQSVGRTGNCYDNAQAESIFASLKRECVSKLHRPDRNAMRRHVTHWIETWYNKQRLHTQLDFMSPEEFETRLRNARND